MTIANQNVDVFRGDTKVIFVALTAADGSPFDPSIVGVDVQWRMAKTSHALESESLIRKYYGSGITVATGGVDVALDAADTDHDSGIYYHEMKVFDGSDAATVMTGVFIIRKALLMGRQVTPPAGAGVATPSVPEVT